MEYKFKQQVIDNAIKQLSFCVNTVKKSGKNFKDFTYWVIYPSLNVKYSEEWKEMNCFWFEVHIFDENKIEEALIRTLKKGQFAIKQRLEHYTTPHGLLTLKEKYIDLSEEQLNFLRKK